MNAEIDDLSLWSRTYYPFFTNHQGGTMSTTLPQMHQHTHSAVTAAVAADALVISPSAAITLKTTGADAEALTLADAAEDGVQILITLAVDGGGSGTLTPATCTGFATIVFADAGDTAFLMYVNDTVGWVILGLYGVAAPPAITI